MMMQGNPYDAFDANPYNAGARVLVPEPPKTPMPQTVDQANNTRATTTKTLQEINNNNALAPVTRRNAELESQLKQIQIQQEQQRLLAKHKDVEEARNDLLHVIGAAADAHRLSRIPQTTGWGSAILGHVPDTYAKDLEGKLNTIGGNIAFERLQRMRQESPTGGAVGNVSDADMKLLQSVVTSLDPTRSRGEFQKSMKQVIDTYGRVLGKLPGGREAYQQWRKGWLGHDPNQPQQQGGGIKFLGFEK